MINSSQTMVASYRYDPFGNTISSSGGLSAANVYRFSSKEIHVSSGMYYYLYRFYDPSLQRWINRDPLGEKGGINLFGFTANAPVAFFDPEGLQDWVPIPCLGNPNAGYDAGVGGLYTGNRIKSAIGGLLPPVSWPPPISITPLPISPQPPVPILPPILCSICNFNPPTMGK